MAKRQRESQKRDKAARKREKKLRRQSEVDPPYHTSTKIPDSSTIL